VIIRRGERSKLKSAISRNSYEKAQADSSAKQYGNKEIADFNLRKSAAIFANELRECRKIAPTSGGSKPPPCIFYRHAIALPAFRSALHIPPPPRI
jgi:hypothetical protein